MKSIKTKMIVYISLIVLVVQSIVTFVNINNSRKSLLNKLDQRTKLITDIFVQNIVLPLFNFSDKTITNIMKSNMEFEQIKAIVIKDPNDSNILYSLTSDNDEISIKNINKKSEIKVIKRKISHSSTVIGYSYIYYTDQHILNMQRKAMLKTFLMNILTIVIIIVALVILLNSTIIKPIYGIIRYLNNKIKRDQELHINYNFRLTQRKNEFKILYGFIKNLFEKIKNSQEKYRSLFYQFKEAITEKNYEKRVYSELDDEGLGDILNNILKNLNNYMNQINNMNWVEKNVNKLTKSITGIQNLEEIGDKILKYFSEILEIKVGSFYVLRSETEEIYDLKSCYGVNKNKMKSNIDKNTGVVGQVIKNKNKKILRNIDKTMFRIETVFIKSIPEYIVIYPLIFEKKVVAVIELGKLSKFSDIEMQLLKSCSKNLAAVINSVLNNIKIKKVLDKTQIQAEELKNKQKELRNAYNELKINTRKIEKQKKEIEEAKEKAERANKLKSNFLANMSHEIRTPMNSILGFTKILLKEIKDEEKLEHLNIIYKAGEKLLQLINDILDFSKIEADKLEINKAPFSLRDTINDIEDILKLKARKKDIYLKVDIQENFPETLIGDEYRINQILFNLIGNAIKFTKEGGVFIKCFYKDNNTVIKIIDTGIGISEKKKKLIFKPFRQADSSTTREFGGTGLGLAITMKLIKLMNGSIDLESEVGEGTEFTIKLPLKVSKMKKQKKDKENKIINFKGKNIGIVEDNKDEEKLIARILNKYGFNPINLPNTHDIVEKILDNNIKLIILDLIMDGLNGFEINNIIKHDERTSHLPVLVCSHSDEIEETIYYGAMDYIRKPIKENKVLKRISVSLNNLNNIKNIYIIDDNEKLLKLYSNYLHKNNYNTFIYENAKSALEEIQTGDNPDLIILDLMMPEMDGFDFLNKLRKDYTNKEIPVIIVTAKELIKDEIKNLSKKSLKIFQKGNKTEEEFIEYINNYFEKDKEIDKKEDIVKNWVEKFPDDESLRNLFYETLKSLPEMVKKINKAISNKDKNKIEKTSHSLKGVAGNYKMDKIYKISADICEKARKDKLNMNKINSSFIRLQNVLEMIPDKYFKEEIDEEKKEKAGKNKEEDKHNILVAEDTAANQKLMVKFLDILNQDCTIVSNGKEALNELKRKNYDILFLDMQMPVMDGEEVLEHIKKNEELKDVYIIALTAHAMKGDKEKYINMGCDDYLSKPVSIESIKSVLSRIK